MVLYCPNGWWVWFGWDEGEKVVAWGIDLWLFGSYTLGQPSN